MKTHCVTTLLLLVLLLFGAMSVSVAAGARLDRPKSFGLPELSGTEPLTSPIEGSDGVLYGTTSRGGPRSAPTLFKIHRDGSNYRVLLSLPGATAISALTEDGDGQLYGTVRATIGTNAAASTSGTVFTLAKDGSAFTVLHTFFRESSAAEGAGPEGQLVLSGGVLYGTAASGGISNSGTLFKLKTDGSGFAVLHEFRGGAAGDGASPRAALLRASDGGLYGTTYYGGTGNYGTIFCINQDGSNYRVLRHFSYGTSDPMSPHSGLLEGPDGALYGTTDNVVFKLNKDGSGLTVLLSGIFPRGVVLGPDGRLYGTSDYGGDTNRGTVFSLRIDGGEFKALHSFLRYDGTGLAGPIQGRDGVLYGADRFGGTGQVGELFRINTNGTGFTVLHNFSQSGGDGRFPAAELLQGSDGDFYGATYSGGHYDRGTVFKARSDGTSTVIYHFGANADDGSAPRGALLEGNDGALYGTTVSGGEGGLYYGFGTVFKLNKDGSGYAVLHHFVGSSSAQWQPSAALLEGRDGLLYGTTVYGGTANAGTVFRLAKDGSGFTILHTFLGSSGADGREPSGRLVQCSDDALYGCTYRGSAAPLSAMDQGYGTLFKVTTDGSDYSVLHSFDYFGGDAARPLQIIEGSDGALYGITGGLAVAGGTSNTNLEGVVFTVQKDGSGYGILHAFGVVTNDGSGPTGILEDVDGTLYGTAGDGGTNWLGTVFRLQKDGTGYASVVSFTDAVQLGRGPVGLTHGRDGAFYGVTIFGGDMDFGAMFRFLPPEFPEMLGVVSGPKPLISFAGAPGIDYELLRSVDLVNWFALKTVKMPPAGTHTHEDITAPISGAFYQVRWLR